MSKALLLTQTEDRKTYDQLVEMDYDRLPDLPVTVDVEFSTLNYKDALAITGRGAIVRNWPMVPGIDLAGACGRSPTGADSPPPSRRPRNRRPCACTACETADR